MFLSDLHCHLDLYSDHLAVVELCERSEVFTLSVTTTPKAWPRNCEVTRRTRFVRAALGFHPQVVAGRKSELGLWDKYLPQTRYVGEVGLDASPGHCESLGDQMVVFDHIVASCAKAGGKVISIHSLRTASKVLDVIERHLPHGGCRHVLHWFTGSAPEAKRALDLGCYFSINSRMLASPRGKELAAGLPQERLLTETDGPFVRVENRPVVPPDIVTLMQSLALVRGLSLATLAEAVAANFHAVVAGLGDEEF